MSRARSLQAVSSLLLALAVTAGAAGCSSDPADTSTTDRGKLVFGQPGTDETRLNLCQAYDDAAMKKLLGGDGYRKLAPQSIGKEDDAVTGERCSWERAGGGNAKLSLTVEASTYGADAAGLEAKFTELQEKTIEATPVPALGDAAFSSVSDATSLLQVRSGPYLITLATRADGEGMEPLDVPSLTFLAAAAVGALP